MSTNWSWIFSDGGNALVEGITDEAVARKLIISCDHDFGVSYGKKGNTFIRQKIYGFNIRAMHGNPILTMIDFMDTDFGCVPEVSRTILPSPSSKMLFRVVVRELESWLIADTDGMATFLGIPQSVVPSDPEALEDPKRTLVNLARRSRSRNVRNSIVPPSGYSSTVASGYVGTIQEFVVQKWNIQEAMKRSTSLMRCVSRLKELHNMRP